MKSVNWTPFRLDRARGRQKYNGHHQGAEQALYDAAWYTWSASNEPQPVLGAGVRQTERNRNNVGTFSTCTLRPDRAGDSVRLRVAPARPTPITGPARAVTQPSREAPRPSSSGTGRTIWESTEVLRS